MTAPKVHCEDHKRTGKPIILFSAMVPQQLHIFHLAKACGLNAAIINGTVSGKDRAQIDRDYRAGKIQCLIGTPEVASVGFNWNMCGDQELEHMIFVAMDHNLIPTKLLAELGIKAAYTGHAHKPDRFARDDVEVVVVGSLQPYAHGEGDLYVTLSLDEARRVDPASLKDKCVRIQLQPGESYDLGLDCLQLTLQRLSDEEESDSVTLGDFDMAALFANAFEQAGVDADLRAAVLFRYDELSAAAC